VTSPVKAAKPAAFPLVLRIPAWAAGATVAINGQAQARCQPRRVLLGRARGRPAITR